MALPGFARTWTVRVDGSGDAPTIQAAVDSAGVGDVILVGPGRYTWNNQGGGNVDYGLIAIFRGQDRFTIRSEAGPEATILDAQRHSRVIYIQGYNAITIEGFTITGGDAPVLGSRAGGGLGTHLSRDTIRDCIFEDNWAQQGGGIWCGGVSTLRVENCEFRGNDATYGAAMLFINSSTRSTVSGCVIDNNIATSHGGGIYGLNNNLNIENTLISRNIADTGSGGGIYLRTMHPSQVLSCTLVQNLSLDGGGIYINDTPTFTLDRTIIASSGGSAFASYNSSVITMSCCDVWGNTGGNELPAGSIDATGNFSLDPLFCDFAGRDFTLNSASPCAPGNHPAGAACDVIGALGVNCGQVHTERRSWGQVKALYR